MGERIGQRRRASGDPCGVATVAEVNVRIGIEAHVPDGVPEHIVRTVTESCRTLEFESQGFEEE